MMKMTLRRKMAIAGIATAALAGLCLAGCSQGASSQQASPSSADTQSVIEQQESGYNGAALDGLKVATMKDAASAGFAYLMQNGWGEYTLCNSTQEAASMLMDDEVQLACVPASEASSLYGRTQGQVRVLAVNALGNLTVVTGDLSIDAVEKLEGHTICMSGKEGVEEYVVRAVLEAAGVPMSEVNLEFASSPAEVEAVLNDDSDAVVVLPEPYAAEAAMKTRTMKQTIDLTSAWEELTGGDRGQLVSSVTVAKAEYVDSNAQMVQEFLEGYGASAKFTNDYPDQAAETLAGLGIMDGGFAEMAIPGCNVVCLAGAEMEGAVSGYLQMLYQQDPACIGGSLPMQDFYYITAGE